MTLGIRAKLFLGSVAVIALSAIAADAYLATALDRLLTDRIRDDLFVRTAMAARDAARAPFALEDRQRWDELADELGRAANARVTIIRRDGVVAGDSELSGPALRALENHSTRPEFIEALDSGRGSSVRYSTTLRQRMMYVAVPFAHGASGDSAGVVRVAMPLIQIDEALGILRRSLLVGLILALAVAVAMSLVTSHVTAAPARALTSAARRMATGDLEVRTRAAGRDELAELGRALDQLAASLSRSLAELRDERDLLGGVLQGMQEGVLLVDGADRVRLVNPALREMLLPGREPVGQLLLEVIRNAEIKALVDRARREDEAAVGEIELGGMKPRRLLVQAEPLSTRPGELLAVVVDVTRLRSLETIRREFVANVSHELRTPVTAVRSASETLREGALRDPESAARFVDIIERNAERLQHLVDDLLDLSRIEARELKLELAPLSVAEVSAHVVSSLRERAERKHIALSVEVPEGTPAARGDRRAVEQVVMNLIDNALKYCPEGAHVAVRAAVEGDAVIWSVVDDGPGIEARHLPRLFERFYRVDPGRSRSLGGTGLGLSIVKHLVEAMGGTASVDSDVGRGSTFSFRLPRA